MDALCGLLVGGASIDEIKAASDSVAFHKDSAERRRQVAALAPKPRAAEPSWHWYEEQKGEKVAGPPIDFEADRARRAAAVETYSWLEASTTLIFVSDKNGAWTPFRSATDFVKKEPDRAAASPLENCTTPETKVEAVGKILRGVRVQKPDADLRFCLWPPDGLDAAALADAKRLVVPPIDFEADRGGAAPSRPTPGSASTTLIFVSDKNGAWTPFRSATDFVKKEPDRAAASPLENCTTPETKAMAVGKILRGVRDPGAGADLRFCLWPPDGLDAAALTRSASCGAGSGDGSPADGAVGRTRRAAAPGGQGGLVGNILSGKRASKTDADLRFRLWPDGLDAAALADAKRVVQERVVREPAAAAESPADGRRPADRARRAAAVETYPWLKESATLIFVSHENGAWTPFLSAKDFVTKKPDWAAASPLQMRTKTRGKTQVVCNILSGKRASKTDDDLQFCLWRTASALRLAGARRAGARRGAGRGDGVARADGRRPGGPRAARAAVETYSWLEASASLIFMRTKTRGKTQVVCNILSGKRASKTDDDLQFCLWPDGLDAAALADAKRVVQERVVREPAAATESPALTDAVRDNAAPAPPSDRTAAPPEAMAEESKYAGGATSLTDLRELVERQDLKIEALTALVRAQQITMDRLLRAVEKGAPVPAGARDPGGGARRGRAAREEEAKRAAEEAEAFRVAEEKRVKQEKLSASRKARSRRSATTTRARRRLRPSVIKADTASLFD
ncbi:hypothetical protein JL721_4605 [Aureococcus anophagefferens]|nr:hypothetical protein JL721_4605 [Aureococcus anophagefferens]